MTRKTIPQRLQLAFRKPELCRKQLAADQPHTPDGDISKTSLDDENNLSFVDLACPSVHDQNDRALQNRCFQLQALYRASGCLKRLFLDQNTGGETTPVSEIEAPKTAPACLEPNLKFRHSRSVPNLKIDPPKLTPEQLAKIDAFYAPTPILPKTPAPRLGKVHPSWSPDINYKFNSKSSASTSLRVVPTSIKTADTERGYLHVESLKRLEASEPVFDVPESKVATTSGFPTPLTSACSEIVLGSGDWGSKCKIVSADRVNERTECWRRTWVYSPDDTKIYSNFNCNIMLYDNVGESKTPVGSSAKQENLPVYFTMGDSPVVGRGEVTLRFIEDPFKGHPSEIQTSSCVPASLEI